MSITISVQVTQESNPWVQLISAVVNGTYKAINNPVFLAFVEGVITLTHKFYLLIVPYRFYDFPSAYQAIGRAVIK
jgi:hypothetical protein